MNVEEVRSYCLSHKGTSEDFPFDENTLVLRVMGKIFAIIPLQHGDRINLKCDPEWAVELREEYEEITPGYHMNKQHWNTVIFTQSVPAELVRKLIDHSYELISKSLKKALRIKLEGL